MAINLFSSREMTGVVLRNFKPKTWLRNTFVKKVENHQTRDFQVDKVTGRRIMAVFTSPLRQGIPIRSKGYSSSTITPGYIKHSHAITPSDLQNRLPGENIFHAPGQAPALLDRAERVTIDILRDMYDAVDRRIEYMTATAITTGKVQIVDMDEKGNVIESREIDFGYHAEHTPTPDVKWDQEDADIIGDLVDWSLLVAKNSGIAPNVLIVSSGAAKTLMNNAKVLELLDTRYANAAEMRIAVDRLNGVTRMGRLLGPGLDIEVMVYSEWFTDPATGTLTAMWPASKVMLGNTESRVEIHTRPIEDFDIAEEYPEAAGGNGLAIPYFVKTWREKDPSVHRLLLQSGPVVVPFEPDAFLCADVLTPA